MDATTIEEIRATLQEPDTRAGFLVWFKGKYPTRADSAEKFANAPTIGIWQNFCQSREGQHIPAPVVEVPSMVAVQPAPDIVPQLTLTAPAKLSVAPTATNGHKPTQQALFELLGQGLRESGFKAAPELDVARVMQIAGETAKTMIDQAIASRRFTTTLEIRVNNKPPVSMDEQTPAWFPRALALATARKNVLLIGPAGSGKSVGARLIAKALGLPYTPISLSGGTDEGVLVGWLLPVAEGGRFTYVPSSFVDAYEHGGVVLLDEMDAADPNVLLIVNEALSNGHFPTPLRRDNPVAARHADFVCLAAANTHGHGADRVYVGRNQLDGATLSRFRMGQINVDYDEKLEASLYRTDVVRYAHRLRERCRAIRGWTRDVSTRDMATAHDLVDAGVLDLGSAWYQYFADWSVSELQKVDVALDHTTGQAKLR